MSWVLTTQAEFLVNAKLFDDSKTYFEKSKFENWLGRCRRRDTLSGELRQRIADTIQNGDTQEAVRLLKEE